MGWSEFRPIPNEYNDEFKAIDEKIIKLLMDRKNLAKGKRYFPQKEIMISWAAEFDMDIPHISWLMHILNEGITPTIPNEPGELLNVLPIMKKSVVDGFEYHLTHSMQHKNGSIVFLEISQCQINDNIGHIRPQLLLEVKGSEEYTVRRNGSHGGGGQTQLRFLVIPRLPDHISEITFALIPYASPMETPPKEIVLNKEISFNS
ncbi:hypothetical protein ACI7RC_06195 [Brevibacillus sp. B_LB10_24]|uniref:hypothetical protein n=1 Tax=Brevibacillus sp. B_LB10_24 TaxID=3380645 RepID=UPI0038B7E6CF